MAVTASSSGDRVELEDGKGATMLGEPKYEVQYALHGSTILLIGEADATAELSAHLANTGSHIQTAHSGVQGLEQAQQLRPDLIALDLQLPDLPGVDVCRRLKTGPAGAVPVVVVTGSGELETKLQAFAAGAIDYIARSVQPAELCARLAAHLHACRAAGRASGDAATNQAKQLTAAVMQAGALLQEQIGARQRVEEQLALERSLLRVVIDHLPDRIIIKDAVGQIVLMNAAMQQFLEGGALAADTQLQADELAIIQSGQPLLGQEEMFVNPDTGAKSWLLTTKAPLRDRHGAIIGLASMSRDITRRKQAEQHLALRFAVTRLVSEAESRQAAAPLLLEAICTNLGWELGELWRIDTARQILLWEGAWHAPSLPARAFMAASRTQTFSLGADLPGRVWQSNQPLQLADLAAHESPRRSLAAEIGLEHCFAFPVRGSSAVLGVLAFWSHEPQLLDADLLATFADISSQIGLFFDRLRAEERLRHYVRRVVDAQEAERDHIARELHDEIGQALALIKMNVRAVQRRAHESDLMPPLEQSLAMTEEALQRVRTMALDLRPSMLNDLGLVTTLRWYVERHAQWAEVEAEIVVEGFETRIPRDLETICFRVAQEALSNIARHAQARSVRIRLWRREDAVHMLIRDDGIGFDVLRAQERAADGASIGLLTMEDRVLLAGGQLVIESAPGRGATVWLRLPLLDSAVADEPALEGE